MTPEILGVVVWQIQITQRIAFALEQTWMTLPTLEIAALPTQDSASALEIILMYLVKVRLTRICSYWESKMTSTDSFCQKYVCISQVL